MRLKTAFKNLAKAYCVWASCSSAAAAQDISATKESEVWIDSHELLNTATPTPFTATVPFVDMMREALVKGLNNVEQHKLLLKMQQEQGTKPLTFGEGYLAKQRNMPGADANATHGLRWSLFRNAKTYAGKEIKFDFVPESLKKGFRFDPTAPKDGAPRPSGITGTPVKYGLILRDIEPAENDLRIASVNYEDDFQYYQNAPQAQLKYEIGPIAVSPVAQTYGVNYAPDYTEPKFNWKDALPDHRFRVRFSPRGAPTMAKPIPDQTMTLEQVQGYYATEVQFANGLHKESLLHRFRLPIYQRFNVAEEFSESFKPTKLIVSDFYSNGPVGTVFEHYFIEKRYRAGIIYRQGISVIELYAHLPDFALNDQAKRLQRWELNLIMPI